MKLINKIALIITITLVILLSACVTVSPQNVSTSRDIVSRDLVTTTTSYTTDTTTYWITTDKTINVSWDAVTKATSYNVVVQWVRGTKILQTYTIGNVTTTNINITLPRVGTFVVGIQSVNSAGQTGSFCYSNDSTCTTVNGSTKTWVIEGYLAPVTGGTIE
jgi:hypothetical protein